jgi:glycosyltransferase involved in cell wall biosynthesis
MTAWHIITCEYPPQIGGVSDYTRLLAEQLRRAGDDIHVWAPTFEAPPEVNVHRELGDFSTRALRQAGELLDSHALPRRLLVQWVPHGYGKRGINLGFSRWIASRVRRGDELYLVVHEPCLEPGQRLWKHRFVALMQRRMLRQLLKYATRVFISIPGWESRVRDLAPPLRRFEWLPIPATIDASEDPIAEAAIRVRFGNGALLLGHLGTYSAELRRVLRPALHTALEQVPNAHALLLGNNGERFAQELKSAAPALAHRIHTVGLLAEGDLANHIGACDLMLQPYPDGLSSRRTSLMNAIARGTPVVSNLGHLTEPLWSESNAVALASTCEPTQLAALCVELLNDPNRRSQLGRGGRELYASRFEWSNHIAALKGSPESARSAPASTSSNRTAHSNQLE